VGDASGRVTSTLWFFETPHPTSVAPTSDPTQLILAGLGLLTLGTDSFTLQVDVDEPDGFHRSHAHLVQPDVFSLRPVFSSNGSAVAYFVDTHPWEWDVKRQTLFDMASGVDAGGPPATLGVSVSPQVAVASDGSRSAFCTSTGSGSGATLPPLFVFDPAGAGTRQIADYAVCAAPTFSFSADGKRLAARAAASPYPGSASLELRVWDFTTRSVTAVPSAASADAYWLGASGRHLLYATGPGSPSTTSYKALYAYDVDAGSTTSLGSAGWVTRSADNRYVAFVGSSGKVVVWSDDSGAATELDPLGPANANISPIPLSPDGQTIKYTDANQDLRVLVLGSPKSAVVAKAVSCSNGAGGTPIVTGVGWGIFSPDSRSLAALAPGGAPCGTGGLTPQAVHLFDIPSSADHTLALPASTAALSAALIAASSSGVVYGVSRPLGGGTEVHLWSPAAGDAVIPLTWGDGLWLSAGVSQDNSRVLFAPSTSISSPETAYLWDRTAGTVPLVSFSGNPVPPFFATFNAQSGVAVAYDSSAKAFLLARPGAPPAQWAQGDDVHIVSPSGNTFAIQGASASEQGLFAISLLSGNAAFLEGGRLLAATDTHVYFVAADGLCEISAP
jgi:hypothetical protein